MAVVYKYPFRAWPKVEIRMTRGARILKFGVQGKDETPTIWALVDETETAGEDRSFRLAPTGQVIDDLPPDALDYLGTVQVEKGGGLVFHLFEVK